MLCYSAVRCSQSRILEASMWEALMECLGVRSQGNRMVTHKA